MIEYIDLQNKPIDERSNTLTYKKEKSWMIEYYIDQLYRTSGVDKTRYEPSMGSVDPAIGKKTIILMQIIFQHALKHWLTIEEVM